MLRGPQTVLLAGGAIVAWHVRAVVQGLRHRQQLQPVRP
jgi:hypothetical protein